MPVTVCRFFWKKGCFPRRLLRRRRSTLSTYRLPFDALGTCLTALCCAEIGRSLDVFAITAAEHSDGSRGQTDDAPERQMGAAESSMSSPLSQRIAPRRDPSDSDSRVTQTPTTGDSSVATPLTLSEENSARHHASQGRTTASIAPSRS